MFSFEKLEVWKKSMELLMEIHDVLKKIRMKGDFELKDQLKRAALSVPTNIAEGVGREKTKEKKHFLNIAKASVYETVSLLIIMKWKKYLSEMYKKCDIIAGMLYALIRSKKFHGI